jgi:hypothetical protein
LEEFRRQGAELLAEVSQVIIQQVFRLGSKGVELELDKDTIRLLSEPFLNYRRLISPTE